MESIKKIVLIGAGNVATQLGLAFQKKGLKIIQVYSQTLRSANILAKKLDSKSTDQLGDLKKNADLYIISITDRIIEKIVKEIELGDRFVVHTSGTIPMDVLQSASNNFGVFYPFQTFSKSKNINFTSVPVCLEANSLFILNELENLAGRISQTIVKVDSEKRKILHLAGVFTNNFSNYLYSIAEIIASENNLDFDLLKPLIRETADKVQRMSPSEAQTGPAVRGDMTIVNEHLELLDRYPDFKGIYSLLSTCLIKQNKG